MQFLQLLVLHTLCFQLSNRLLLVQHGLLEHLELLLELRLESLVGSIIDAFSVLTNIYFGNFGLVLGLRRDDLPYPVVDLLCACRSGSVLRFPFKQEDFTLRWALDFGCVIV